MATPSLITTPSKTEVDYSELNKFNRVERLDRADSVDSTTSMNSRSPMSETNNPSLSPTNARSPSAFSTSTTNPSANSPIIVTRPTPGSQTLTSTPTSTLGLMTVSSLTNAAPFPTHPSTSGVYSTNGSGSGTGSTGGIGVVGTSPSTGQDICLDFGDDPRLAALAQSILDSSWYKEERMEPVVESHDEIAKQKIVRPGESRFRAFLEMTPTRTYKCQFQCIVREQNPNGDGVIEERRRCERTEERLDRAQGHARQHFNYRPFVCGGKCARPDCSQRFFSSGQKDDHIRRSIPRRKECEQCGKQISIQNVSRHMKVIHQQSMGSPQEKQEKEKPGTPLYKPY